MKKRQTKACPGLVPKELPLVVCERLTTYDDIMGRWLEARIKQGYKLMCPPVFIGLVDPMRYGLNVYAVSRQPEFLVCVTRLPENAAPML